jgi:hypothetical protein
MPNGALFARVAIAGVFLALCAMPVRSETRVEGATDHHHSAPAGVSATGQTPEEELAYSLFMHHSSGVAVLVIGALVLVDRVTGRRWRALPVGIGLAWLVFGTHVFIRSDVEGWPLGPAGFLESFSMPTAGEWLQHKVLSLIPLGLGIFSLASQIRDKGGSRPGPANRNGSCGSLVVALLAVLGGAGLLVHQHADHPGMDLVNIQHRLMAVSSLFIAASAVLDMRDRTSWRIKPYLLPVGLIVIGIQLALYVE